MADCPSNKVDSNSTGLAFAEEVCAKVLPTVEVDGYLPTWYELEPNSYDDFGAELTSTARTPIKRNRQRSKGTTTDLDADGAFNEDHTQRNHDRLFQGFFFANFHEQATTKPLNGDQIVITGIATANDRYAAAAGLTVFEVSDIVRVSGADNEVNNGRKLVDEVAATYVGVTDNLTDETPSGEVIVTKVGHRFGAGAVAITMAGDIPSLVVGTPAVAADAVLTIDATFNAVAAETVTIGGVVYTFVAGVPTTEGEVQIGGSRLTTLANLTATINGSSTLTDAHPLVRATDGGDGTMTITARTPGTVGNGIVTAEDLTNGSWDGNTAGGTGYSLLSLGITAGQWVFLGGDETDTAFANNVGYARVASVNNSVMVFDKTTWEAEAEAAGTFTIEIYVGDYITNENDPSLILTKYFQFERSLGQAPAGTQAEYLRGAVANELTFNLETADKVTVDLGFIAADQEVRTFAENLKAGDREGALNEDAYNTTSDVVRLALQVIDPTNSYPANALFAYATEGTLTINNNVSAVKAIAALGGIDVSVGSFDVEAEVTVLFTTVEAIQAIRQNLDVTFDMIFAKLNQGHVWDIPLLGLGGGRPAIEANEPVTLPLTIMGAQSKFDNTLSYTSFDYLPTVAMPE